MQKPYHITPFFQRWFQKKAHRHQESPTSGNTASRKLSGKDAWITLALLLIATALSFLYFNISANSANIALLYILALVLVARLTDGYLWGIIASLAGVIAVNFLFTYPYFALNFTLTGYPVTFIGMLAISLMTSAATTHMKQQMQMLAERERLLIEAEKEKMRANLLRAISHDLRTPLTSIIGSSSYYLENDDSIGLSEKTDLVRKIQEDSNWLLNMVENLLSVTRLQDGAARVIKSQEPVEEVVAAAMLRLKKRLPEAEIHVRVPEELILLPMDPILIEQVLINLMENAVCHSRSEAPILCYVEEDPGQVFFHVRDYGIGIPADHLAHVFDGSPYNGSNSSDSSKGLGIGLSICKTIITAHHGEIAAIHCEKGTDFYFSLPKDPAIPE